MLVTAEEMLKKAKAGKYAVGQFNPCNRTGTAEPGYPWCFRGCW